MNNRSQSPATGASRLPKIVGAIVMAAAFGVVCVLSGESVSRRTVVFGQNWPAGERVAIDEIDHRGWDRLLQRFVDDAGVVDYAGSKESPADLQALDGYLSALSRAEPNRQSSREGWLAFWINAYNALTIRGILLEYPAMGLGGGGAPPGQFDPWRDVCLHVGERKFSLDLMEHELLRPMREPRVHFAIVCGARGCPRLLNRAYKTGELEHQLRENSRNFFADPRKLEYDPLTGTLRLSPIMNWYAKDFGGSDREVLESIAPYLPVQVTRQRPRAGGLRARYLDYNWNLNEQTAPPIPPATATADSGAHTEDPD